MTQMSSPRALLYESAGARRAGLKYFDNPRFGSDYIVSLFYRSRVARWRVTLKVWYIPDKSVLDIASFEVYADALPHWQWHSLEQLAAAVIDDVNNELVPRWVRVGVSGTLYSRSKQSVIHRVLCEDKQPGWTSSGGPLAGEGMNFP